MSIQFIKSNDKSYILRGEILDDPEIKESFSRLSKELKGRVIFNTRLKGGKGYLIPVNEYNKEQIEEWIKKNDFKDASEKESKDSSEKTKESTHKPESEQMFKKDNLEKKSPRRSDIKKFLEEKRIEEKYKNSQRETGSSAKKSHKSQDSDSESESESEESDSSKSRSKHSGSKSRSEDDSDVESSSESDNSEDERIRYSLERRPKTPENEIAESVPLNSNTEDIVSLTRRMRGLYNRLRKIEKRLKDS